MLVTDTCVHKNVVIRKACCSTKWPWGSTESWRSVQANYSRLYPWLAGHSSRIQLPACTVVHKGGSGDGLRLMIGA